LKNGASLRLLIAAAFSSRFQAATPAGFSGAKEGAEREKTTFLRCLTGPTTLAD
jgi:hypothetical protein